MVKCVVTERFTLKDFDQLVNVKRATSIDTPGYLVVGDEFECSETMAKYLTGENDAKKVVVKVLEVQPKEDVKPLEKESIEKVAQEVLEEVKKPKKKTSKKK